MSSPSPACSPRPSDATLQQPKSTPPTPISCMSSTSLGTSQITLSQVVAWDCAGTEDRAIIKFGSDGTSAINTRMEIKLCFVAEISTSDFWMDADGGYMGKAFVDGTIPSFAKTKGSLVIVEPRMEPWKDDFRHVVKAFRWLEDQTCPQATSSRSTPQVQPSDTTADATPDQESRTIEDEDEENPRWEDDTHDGAVTIRSSEVTERGSDREVGEGLGFSLCAAPTLRTSPNFRGK
ncbi:hypothetical protein JB92DRAFT_3108231 [Gautieria morchelliformis]|nr:hypothetical protein JB92DRAFT_3108231 [Gautieria morchelliformis]